MVSDVNLHPYSEAVRINPRDLMPYAELAWLAAEVRRCRLTSG